MEFYHLIIRQHTKKYVKTLMETVCWLGTLQRAGVGGNLVLV